MVEFMDLNALNDEFVALLDKHENDKAEVNGRSHDEYEKWKKGEDPDSYDEDYTFGECCQFHAMIHNAWDELCANHEGLAESGLNWWFGASENGYQNEYDLYVGPDNH